MLALVIEPTNKQATETLKELREDGGNDPIRAARRELRLDQVELPLGEEDLYASDRKMPQSFRRDLARPFDEADPSEVYSDEPSLWPTDMQVDRTPHIRPATSPTYLLTFLLVYITHSLSGPFHSHVYTHPLTHMLASVFSRLRSVRLNCATPTTHSPPPPPTRTRAHAHAHAMHSPPCPAPSRNGTPPYPIPHPRMRRASRRLRRRLR
jgi:hypothetical protein